jgi:GNAT superfamily N-acetyltransferase
VSDPAPPPISSDRLIVRPVGPEEAPRLQAVYEAAGDYFPAVGLDAPGAETALQELRQCQAQPGRAAALVTLADGADVGALGWWSGRPEPEVALLGMVVIVPERRGQGLAREALTALETHLADSGITRLRTAIPYRRAAALRGLLGALGFREMSIAEHTRMGMGGAATSLWEKAIG